MFFIHIFRIFALLDISIQNFLMRYPKIYIQKVDGNIAIVSFSVPCGYLLDGSSVASVLYSIFILKMQKQLIHMYI